MKKNDSPEVITCDRCGKTVPKITAYEKDGKIYCCPDCAHNIPCDCQ